MINESKYRRQALQSWQADREQILKDMEKYREEGSRAVRGWMAGLHTVLQHLIRRKRAR